jgi:hypothetical protein
MNTKRLALLLSVCFMLPACDAGAGPVDPGVASTKKTAAPGTRVQGGGTARLNRSTAGTGGSITAMPVDGTNQDGSISEAPRISESGGENTTTGQTSEPCVQMDGTGMGGSGFRSC